MSGYVHSEGRQRPANPSLCSARRPNCGLRYPATGVRARFPVRRCPECDERSVRTAACRLVTPRSLRAGAYTNRLQAGPLQLVAQINHWQKAAAQAVKKHFQMYEPISGRKCRMVMIGARTANMNEVGVELLEPFNDFWRTHDPPKGSAQFREAGNGWVVEVTGTKLKVWTAHLRRRNFMTRSESAP